MMAKGLLDDVIAGTLFLRVRFDVQIVRIVSKTNP